MPRLVVIAVLLLLAAGGGDVAVLSPTCKWKQRLLPLEIAMRCWRCTPATQSGFHLIWHSISSSTADFSCSSSGRTAAREDGE